MNRDQLIVELRKHILGTSVTEHVLKSIAESILTIDGENGCFTFAKGTPRDGFEQHGTVIGQFASGAKVAVTRNGTAIGVSVIEIPRRPGCDVATRSREPVAKEDRDKDGQGILGSLHDAGQIAPASDPAAVGQEAAKQDPHESLSADAGDCLSVDGLPNETGSLSVAPCICREGGDNADESAGHTCAAGGTSAARAAACVVSDPVSPPENAGRMTTAPSTASAPGLRESESLTQPPERPKKVVPPTRESLEQLLSKKGIPEDVVAHILDMTFPQAGTESRRGNPLQEYGDNAEIGFTELAKSNKWMIVVNASNQSKPIVNSDHNRDWTGLLKTRSFDYVVSPEGDTAKYCFVEVKSAHNWLSLSGPSKALLDDCGALVQDEISVKVVPGFALAVSYKYDNSRPWALNDFVKQAPYCATNTNVLPWISEVQLDALLSKHRGDVEQNGPRYGECEVGGGMDVRFVPSPEHQCKNGNHPQQQANPPSE